MGCAWQPRVQPAVTRRLDCVHSLLPVPLQAARCSSGPSLACVSGLSCCSKTSLSQSGHCSELLCVANLHVTEQNSAGSCRDLAGIIFLYLNEALKLVYIVINIIIIVAMAVCPRCLES